MLAQLLPYHVFVPRIAGDLLSPWSILHCSYGSVVTTCRTYNTSVGDWIRGKTRYGEWREPQAGKPCSGDSLRLQPDSSDACADS